MMHSTVKCPAGASRLRRTRAALRIAASALALAGVAVLPSVGQESLPSDQGELIRWAREVKDDAQRKAAALELVLDAVRIGEGNPVALGHALSVLGVQGLMTFNVAGTQAAEEAWEQRLVLLPEDGPTLKAAASFWTLRDRERSEELLMKGWDLYPLEPQWPAQLARLDALGRISQSGEERQATDLRTLTLFEAALARMGDAEAYATLAEIARAAYNAGRHAKAQAHATRLLELAENSERDWNLGNALHHGHTTLGLVDLADGNVESAARHLRLSGEHSGSPQLNSFGPSMRLAAKLLETGERQAVIDYLESCKSFWTTREEALASWAEEIAAGGSPTLPNQHR